jgi:hypothetical protein
MTTHGKFLLAVSLAAFTLAAVTANADLTMYNVSFEAHDFQVGSGGDPPPVDPVVGNFTITFDPSVAVTNSTSGITLNSLNIALGSALSYSYDPAAGGFPAGTLRVGGAASGSDTITFNPSTNDFWLFINDFTGTAAFQQVGYTQTSVSNNNLFFTLNQTGSADVTIVPEPASASLLVTGLTALVAGVIWRRRRR